MIRRLISRAQRRARDLRSDAGFTLVEIIIAVSLLGLVTGAGVTSLVTATRGSSALSLSAHESSDAQLISAFLVRDAQAAGGTDPETGITDPTLGVSASNSAGCAPAGTLVARFKWRDRKSTGSDEKVASYGLNGVHELVRRVCTNNVSGGDLLLGTNVASAALTCDGAAGACPAFPKFVTLSLSGTNTANPFSYQLTAQLRSESQDAPSTNNSAPVPILALGGTTCPQSGAFIDMNGTNNLTVDLGGVLVNTSLAGCKGLSINNNSTYSTDSTSVLTGPGAPCLPLANCPAITGYPTPLLDPLRNLPVPPEAAQCLGSGTNPAKIGTHYQAGVYYTLVTTNSGDTFDGGTYVFCNGLKISGDLTAANVLLYFAGGTLDMINTPRVTLGPQTSGPYANVSIWLPKTNTQTKLTINGNTGISLYSGIVYSPATTVYIGGGAEVRIASIIAYAIVLTGNGHEVFGPGVSITTPQIAAFTWSSTPHATLGDSVHWGVDFTFGTVDFGTSQGLARCVKVP